MPPQKISSLLLGKMTIQKLKKALITSCILEILADNPAIDIEDTFPALLVLGFAVVSF
ncbi:MAG: hypothetical protein ACTSQK_10840 [Candidatus Heimdallarchaeota archaeon]